MAPARQPPPPRGPHPRGKRDGNLQSFRYTLKNTLYTPVYLSLLLYIYFFLCKVKHRRIPYQLACFMASSPLSFPSPSCRGTENGRGWKRKEREKENSIQLQANGLFYPILFLLRADVRERMINNDLRGSEISREIGSAFAL